jgi:tetratricopeptide (TPR) repeat protein
MEDDSLYARFNQACALRAAGKVEEALREFEAFANDVEDPQIKGSLLINQAKCLGDLRRIQEARARQQEAEKLWPGVDTEYLDACVCVDEGKVEIAVNKLILLLKNHPDLKQTDYYVYTDARERLGRLYFQLGKYADAVPLLEEALELPGNDEQRRDLSYCLGCCQMRSGDLEAAEKNLVQSLPSDRRHSDWVHAQYQLGMLYYHRGAYLDAEKAFELCTFFMDEAGTGDEIKNSISEWLAGIRRMPGSRLKPALPPD